MYQCFTGDGRAVTVQLTVCGDGAVDGVWLTVQWSVPLGGSRQLIVPGIACSSLLTLETDQRASR